MHIHEDKQKEQPVQRKANNTGLPDNLKSGIENLSGYAMDDVNVHYNSSRPAQMQAHAYAQGTDIHLASGQEKHLPHEAWHVVQQKQGRVKPTLQMKGKLSINDEAGLEHEADVMGARALQMNPAPGREALTEPSTRKISSSDHAPMQFTMEHTNQVVDRYNAVNPNGPQLTHYNYFASIWLDSFLRKITPEQYDNLVRAYNLQPDGRALPLDRQGKP